MNKYIVLALLPVLFQSSLYCEDQFKDIDHMIQPQLISARNLMKSTMKLELQIILDALVLFAKKGNLQASQTVDCMKAIKGALAHYRTEEYKTTWDNICWFFGSNPKKVVEEIDPAIDKVNNALKTVGANSSNLGYTVAAAAAGLAVAATIAAAAAWYLNQPKSPLSSDDPEDWNAGNYADEHVVDQGTVTSERLAGRYAMNAAKAIAIEGSDKYKKAYSAAYKAVLVEVKSNDIDKYFSANSPERLAAQHVADVAAQAAVAEPVVV